METNFCFKSDNLPGLMTKIEKLNKRARKNGLAELVVEITGTELVKNKRPEFASANYPDTYTEYTKGVVKGEAPVVAGWKIVGSIDYSAGFNVLKAFEELPEKYRECDPFCDHCNTKRVKKKTVLLKSVEDETIMQVGTSCLKDFIPVSVADEIYFCNFWTELTAGFEDADGYFGGGRMEPVVRVKDAVSVAVTMVRNFGFVSSQAYEGIPTRSNMTTFFFGSGESRNELIKSIEFDTEADDARADEIIEWVLNNESNNDFFYNLKGFMSQESVHNKYFGYIAGAVSAYNKYLGQIVERQAHLNEYLPGVNVKDRIELELTLKRVFVNDGFYGYTYIHTFHDAEGRTLMWFGTKKLGDEGETYKVKATIKDFKEYKDVKQTVLTRVTEI